MVVLRRSMTYLSANQLDCTNRAENQFSRIRLPEFIAPGRDEWRSGRITWQSTQADVEINQTACRKTYNQAEQQLVNDGAWLPMYQVSATYLLKPYVISVVDNSGALARAFPHGVFLWEKILNT